MGEPEDAVIEPVFGDVAVDQRVTHDMREFKIEDKPQQQAAKKED